MKLDSLGDRMKRYESVSSTKLMCRNPVIVRLDGKAFHTFTRGLTKPFDMPLVDTMANTALHLCEEMQGACFAYTQSDEISIVLQDWENLTTNAWFGNNVQKIVSVSASITTAYFNAWYTHPRGNRLALFDARAFSIPMDEVANYFVWRQNDCIRNSISSVGQANFSHKELDEKSTKMVVEMLETERGIKWADIPNHLKVGTCVKAVDGKLAVDKNGPVFTDDRKYIEDTYTFGAQ